MRNGKLIVLYGINNLGKTTQAKLLVDHILTFGEHALYLKYPLYELEPTGPMINEYLRERNPLKLSPREFQVLQVLNRTQYQPILQKCLGGGTHVVAEDYIGTGIAWGVGAGVDEAFLFRLNSHLLKDDIAFLFDGERFIDGKEPIHTHEDDDELTERVRTVHLALAEKLGWHIIHANESVEVIHDQIWNVVKQELSN